MEPMAWVLTPYQEYCTNNPQTNNLNEYPYPKRKEAQHIRDEMMNFRTTAADYAPNAVPDVNENAAEVSEKTHDEEQLDEDEDDAEHVDEPPATPEPIEQSTASKPVEDSTTEEKASEVSAAALPTKLQDASNFMSKQAVDRSTKLYRMLINLPNSSYNDLHDTYKFDNLQFKSSSLLARLLNDFCTKRAATSKTSPPDMDRFWGLLSQLEAAKVYAGAFYRAKYGNTVEIRKSNRIKSLRLTNPPSFSSLNL